MKRLRTQYAHIVRKLEEHRLRPTRQRILLGELLFSQGCRHLSPEQLHKEALEAGVRVSLATVYNTLHQFTEVGLLREIAIDTGKSCFDTNIDPHHHFLCEVTGKLMDIPADSVKVDGLPTPPPGAVVSGVDVVIRLRPQA